MCESRSHPPCRTLGKVPPLRWSCTGALTAPVNGAGLVHTSCELGPLLWMDFWVKLFISQEKQISKGFSFQQLMSLCHQLHPCGCGNNVSSQPAASVDGCYSDFHSLEGFKGSLRVQVSCGPRPLRPTHLG